MIETDLATVIDTGIAAVEIAPTVQTLDHVSVDRVVWTLHNSEKLPRLLSLLEPQKLSGVARSQGDGEEQKENVC